MLSQDSVPDEPIREAPKRRRMPKPKGPSVEDTDATPRRARSPSIELVERPAQPVASTSKSPPSPPRPTKHESELARMMREYGPVPKAPAPLTAEERARREKWRAIAEQPTQVQADRYLDFGASIEAGPVDSADDSVPICPFCDEPLPTEPSQRLLDAIEELKQRDDAERDYDSPNPNAYELPFGVAETVCRRHRDESHTIPEGRARGWPSAEEIDWARLPRRIKREAGARIAEVITAPRLSTFHAEAVEWYEEARAAPGVLGGYSTFEHELPG